MNIIKPSATVVNPFEGYMTMEEYMKSMVQHIETVGRVCYKSEDKITEDSYETFVRNIIDRGHEAVIEHSGFTVRFVVDRGVSHEIVRHRIASYAQESTRYCNYNKDKFGNEITVIMPCFFDTGIGTASNSLVYKDWERSCEVAEYRYLKLLKQGATPQEARSVLPNSLKTEVMMTANFREWRNFFKLRTPKGAHPQMREVAIPLLRDLQSVCPIIFDDIPVPEDV